ncbi:Murein L,D-transpeptidase YcbB/YkuD [Sphingomonas guangdongensis]|uniref:Murein L,D-transpeptidase YcbB/YkuD n=1 Tax=Sphingomonas guangdongensis TaxID=1141890 RepID=A0A285QZ94_9SPHN|nr:Murein L,D-transpeptidase YcbB/YkuD [Sphingomonas guangdongensis]
MVAPFLALLIVAGSGAAAQAPASDLGAAIRSVGGPRSVTGFYRINAHRPLWISDGVLSPAAETLLALIETADLDGLDPDDYRPRALRAAIDRARDGSPRDLARAELQLSAAFVAYARDLREAPDVGMIYADQPLRPRPATATELLAAAAAAPSLDTHLRDFAWMNPAYGALRRSAALNGDRIAADDAAWTLVRRNLDRLRALPANPGKRFVLVDAAAARLWMYEDNRVVGTMRVVVGKPSEPTPMMAALIRYASVNPYWNVPPDLARNRYAPEVLAKGVGVLRAKRFQALADWSENAAAVPLEKVDWRAVADGRTELRLRQLPGPGNGMGRVKFMFPNELGVYLHDTPEKALLKETDRLFSSGCVRLEDAPRLGRWLFGRPLPTGGAPERRVDLPTPVPVYITYLTVAAEQDRLVYRDDVYGRDGGGALLASR